MLFWMLCAVLTAAVLYAVTRPLSAAANTDSDSFGDAAADISVYRDQLKEIDADRARGLLTDPDAEAARTEVSRRLLARSQSSPEEGRRERSGSAQGALIVAAAAIPIVSIALYLAFGAPGLPGQPHASREVAAVEDASVADLVARVEARLRMHPEDGQGWDVIAPVYMRLGRFSDAVQAYQRAIRLLGDSPARLAGLGEALALGANGVVTEEARATFERLAARDRTRPEPRFWLALAKEQDGNIGEALEDFRRLLADTPQTVPWRGAVEERIAVLMRKGGGAATGEKAQLPGPSAEDVAAADALSPAERAAMIDGMVERLAERLKANGQDLAGWQRLLRAYAVLGRKDEAAAALARARTAFAGDSASLAALDDLARRLGLDS